MDEHPPTVAAHQPLDGDTAAMGPQLMAPLAVAGRVGRSFAVELWTAFAKTEQRTLAERKCDDRRFGIKRELLNRHALHRIDVQRSRIGAEANDEIAGGNRGEVHPP